MHFHPMIQIRSLVGLCVSAVLVLSIFQKTKFGYTAKGPFPTSSHGSLTSQLTSSSIFSGTNHSKPSLSLELSTIQHAEQEDNHRRVPLGRPIDFCPDGRPNYISFCRSQVSPQAFSMLCGGPERLQFSFFDGACLADEICVNQTGARLAWCVTNINFVKLRNRELGRPIRFRQGYSHALPWPWPITKKTVSAIITDTTGTKSVAANRLEIKAVKRKEIFDAVTYTTLEGGLGTCDVCSSVAIQAVPKLTNFIQIDAVLPDEISEANVYVI